MKIQDHRFLQRKHSQSGLTLVELLAVLVILIAVGGIVTTLVSNVTVKGIDGEDLTPQKVATLATMRTVSEALVGASSSEPGYRQDVGELPSRLDGLILNIDGAPEPYDPATKRGWRGPYLLDIGTTYRRYSEAGGNFPDPPENDDDPAVLDGWGTPLLLINEGDFSRIVSAGPPPNPDDPPTFDSPTSMPGDPSDFTRGNDLVLFLFTNDPNPPDPNP